MASVTLSGDELEGVVIDEPAASVRLLLPSPGSEELVMPSWTGNEFLLADGRRAMIRTFTPRRVDPAALELDLEIVVHGNGAASDWVEGAAPGVAAAVAGPKRGYVADPAARCFVLAGDETAIPAISQLLETLPPDKPVQVHIEVADPDGLLRLPDHPNATIEWSDLLPGAQHGDTLVAAVAAANLEPGTRIWAAGEAAAMQRIRRHLFDKRGLSRTEATVRGYWKHGRAGGDT